MLVFITCGASKIRFKAEFNVYADNLTEAATIAYNDAIERLKGYNCTIREVKHD